MVVGLPDLLGVLPVYNKDKKVVSDDDQDTSEIIKYIKLCHEKERADYDKIAEYFWKGNAKDTAKGLFDFLKKNVTYKIEPEEFQSVKTPGVILKQGYGDCKHYALFTTGVVEALQRAGHPIKAFFRFVSDKPGKEVHHVFSVVKGGGGTYWVDPVLKNFDSRPDFCKIKDL